MSMPAKNPKPHVDLKVLLKLFANFSKEISPSLFECCFPES